MRHYHIVLAATVLLCAACSSDTAPTPLVDQDAQGSWELDTRGAVIPGISFFLTLGESAGVITGTGTFTGEAAPFGTLAANGPAANDSLHLRIIYIYDPTTFPQLAPDTAQFQGALIDVNHIQGQLTFARSATTEQLNLMRVPSVTGTSRGALIRR